MRNNNVIKIQKIVIFNSFYQIFYFILFKFFLIFFSNFFYFLEANDEFIDGKMIANNYLKSSIFILDLLSTLPIAEIADLVQGR
jgi:hypothetical protein